MRAKSLSVVVGIVALFTAAPALAAPAFSWTGAYIELGGGPSTFAPTLSDLTTNGIFSPSIVSTDLARGFDFNAALGTQLMPGLRGEIGLNVAHGSGKFGVEAEGSGTIGVTASSFALTANLWKDFPINSMVSFHVGGGLGAGVITESVTEGNPSTSSTAGLAYMAGFGAAFGLGNTGTELTVDYRLNGIAGGGHGTGSVDTGFETIGGTLGTTLDQAITVGIRVPLGH